MGVDGQRHVPAALFPGKKDRVAFVQEAGWAPGPVWTGSENVASTGFNPWTIRSVASRCYTVTSNATDVVIETTAAVVVTQRNVMFAL